MILTGPSEAKSAFDYAQNAQIQIILRMRKVSSGLLLFIHTLCSIQSFCKRTLKALIRLPSLSTYARRRIFALCDPAEFGDIYRFLLYIFESQHDKKGLTASAPIESFEDV